MKKASMGLIAAGLVLLVYGLFMDTSISSYGERVHNIGLMNDRIAILIAGGFMFLGGLILFSILKIKLPNEQKEESITGTKAKPVNFSLPSWNSSSKLVRWVIGFVIGIPVAFAFGGISVALTTVVTGSRSDVHWIVFIVSFLAILAYIVRSSVSISKFLYVGFGLSLIGGVVSLFAGEEIGFAFMFFGILMCFFGGLLLTRRKTNATATV